ncbi:MAG: hypothetical protein KJ600_00395 [Nanoarchaeota archaeon]|nr:hypothetical protein [Nanoarchaeota archaeon]
MVKREFILLMFVSVILFGAFALADHTVTTSGGLTRFDVVEDVQNFYNITVNITGTTEAGNVTEVNITLPSNFTYNPGIQNGTDALGTFTNTSSVLSWSNYTGYLINSTAAGALKNFWFNATAATPGNYNLTVSVVNGTGTYWSNISVYVNDSTAPSSVTINTPVSGGNYSGNLVLNATVTDNGVIGAVFFNITNSTGQQNATYTGGAQGNEYNVTIPTAGFPDGIYNITVWANDTWGNLNNTVLVSNVVFDNTGPGTVNFVAPTNVTGTNLTTGVINYNVSVTSTVAGIGTITMHLYNNNSIEINNATSSTSPLNGSFTGLANGIYYINASVNDTAGNINWTGAARTLNITDSVIPLISYDGATAHGANVSSIFVNVSVTEINEANITFKLFYTNHTVVNTTVYTDASRSVTWSGMADGGYYYNATIVDYGNNKNYTSTRTVLLDGTAPVVAPPTKSSSSTKTQVVMDVAITESGSNISGSCGVNGYSSVTVGGSGTNAQTITLTGFSCGQSNSFIVSCTDRAGNTGSSASTTISTDACSGGGGSGGGGTPSLSPSTVVWKTTYTEDDKPLNEKASGVTKALGKEQRVKLKVTGETHYVGVVDIVGDLATVEVSSDPQEATLSVGETKKFEIDDDDYYDINIMLNSISNNKAEITISYVHELIPEQVVPEEPVGSDDDEVVLGEDEDLGGEEGAGAAGTWIITIIILVVVAAVIAYYLSKKKTNPPKRHR